MSDFSDRMVRLARGKASAFGYTLGDDAAAAVGRWVERLQGSVAEERIPDRVELLVEAMISRSPAGTTLGMAAFRAALAEMEGVKEEESTTGGGTGGAGGSSATGGIQWSGGSGSGFGFGMTEGGFERFEMDAEPERPMHRTTRSAPPPMAGGPPPVASAPAVWDEPATAAAAGPMEEEPAAPVPESRPAPRSAYALLDAPETVVAQVDFEVRVGLAEKQSAGVIGEALVLPESTIYPYKLALQLVAEGFELADGGGWDREVIATEDAPYPSTVFRLRALPQAEAVHARALKVLYSIGGQTIGFAIRPVAVVRTAAELANATPPSKTPAVDMAVPTELRAPDLTIHILRDDDVADRLIWKLQSPHAAVGKVAPDGTPLHCRIGNEPKEYAKQLIKQVNQRKGSKLHRFMEGNAKELADIVPTGVWEAIHAAAKAVGGPPTILVLSEEPYVPWELAYVPDPLPDPAAPGYLGAQARIGRWVLGQRNPPFPPPSDLAVASMAVVWGEYDGSRWEKLDAAREEAEALHQEYGAIRIDATSDPVFECIDGTPPAQALHFAIHGLFNPGSLEDGLILTDEEPVTFQDVRAGSLPQRPLVFLNACQVGSGQQFLGDYAGIASAFLDIHASAVIAPLWSVNDVIAKDISLSFYREAFAGEPVATVLRRVRAKTGKEEAATYLAYQFFGHPELRLTRPAPATPTPSTDP